MGIDIGINIGIGIGIDIGIGIGIGIGRFAYPSPGEHNSVSVVASFWKRI